MRKQRQITNPRNRLHSFTAVHNVSILIPNTLPIDYCYATKVQCNDKSFVFHSFCRIDWHYLVTIHITRALIACYNCPWNKLRPTLLKIVCNAFLWIVSSELRRWNMECIISYFLINGKSVLVWKRFGASVALKCRWRHYTLDCPQWTN